MGILNKSRFVPKELTSDTIEQFFLSCRASEKTKQVVPIRLKDSDLTTTINLDLEKTQKHSKSIRYILGQLKVVHDKTRNINYSDLRMRYDGEPLFDESDKTTQLQLFTLCVALRQTSKLADDNSLTLISTQKTLSPYDPDFPAWWAGHEAEWKNQTQEQPQTRRPGGTEPFDN